MDPEFQHLLTRVVIVGGVIGVVSFTVLFFAFRAFGERQERGGILHGVLLIALLVFIVLACLLLLRLSPELK
jgi:uncharacterized membrane-anchored protein